MRESLFDAAAAAAAAAAHGFLRTHISPEDIRLMKRSQFCAVHSYLVTYRLVLPIERTDFSRDKGGEKKVRKIFLFLAQSLQLALLARSLPLLAGESLSLSAWMQPGGIFPPYCFDTRALRVSVYRATELGVNEFPSFIRKEQEIARVQRVFCEDCTWVFGRCTRTPIENVRYLLTEK